MIKKQIHIITGGPGFGKTTLIKELRSRGYLCSDEFARDLIEQQIDIGSELLPWKRPKAFQEVILRQRIDFFESVPVNTLAFADRGIVDQLAFARYRGFGTPLLLQESVNQYRYAPHVFITPAWPEIFVNDPIRQESLEEAILIHQAIIATFSELNYELIELPLLPVSQRADFIFQHLRNNQI